MACDLEDDYKAKDVCREFEASIIKGKNRDSRHGREGVVVSEADRNYPPFNDLPDALELATT